MKQKLSGSQKMQQQCAQLATLTPDEINAVAGGAVMDKLIPRWFPIGTPDPYPLLNLNRFEVPGLAAAKTVAY